MGVVSTLKSIGNAIKFAASATIGVAVALPALVLAGTAAVVLTGMANCWSYIHKKKFGRDIVENHFLRAWSDGAKDLCWGILRNCFSAHLQTAQYVSNCAEQLHDYADHGSYRDFTTPHASDVAIGDSQEVQDKGLFQQGLRSGLETKYSVQRPEAVPLIGGKNPLTRG